MDNERDVPVARLVLVPAIVTLVVTLVRLTGELMHWSPQLFGRAAGGGGSLIGISWLVPLFGIYFAFRLVRMGFGPTRLWMPVASAVCGIAVVTVSGFAAARAGLGPLSGMLAMGLAALLAVAIAWTGWRELGSTLFVYALAARIPVALVMLIAIFGGWGTHYDVADPRWPEVDTFNPLVKWLAIGALPQFTAWIAFTVAFGMLVGGVIPLFRRWIRKPVPQPA